MNKIKNNMCDVVRVAASTYAFAALAIMSATTAVASLPAGYTQLTYIESSGTQYIDTGVVPQSDSRLVCDFQYTSLPASSGVAWNGCCAAGSRDSLLFGIREGNFSASACSPGGGSIVFVSTGVPADEDRHTVDIQNSAMCFDDKSFATGTLGNTFTANDTMYLFARHIGWSPGGANSHCSMRIYSCQIYAGDTLERNYIPACRNSDMVVGLFDLKNGKFYGNAGTGSFTMGDGFTSDAMLHISSSPTGIGSPSPAYGVTNGLVAGASFLVSCGATSVTNAALAVQYFCAGWKLFDLNDEIVASGVGTSFTYTHPNPAEYRRLEWQWAHRPITNAVVSLPNGYRQLRSITSTGTQAIKTLLYPTSNMTVEMTFNTGPYESERAFFGQGYSNNNFLFVKKDNKYKFYGGGTVVSDLRNNSDAHLSITSDNKFILDYGDTAVTTTVSRAVQSAPPLDIFSDGWEEHRSSFTLYAMTISIDGNMRFDFVPAKRISDGKGGLYDLIGKQFYPDWRNSATPFELGDPVVIEDTLNVSSSMDGIGSPSPAYGDKYYLAAGDTLAVSCDAKTVTDGDGAKFFCSGWKLYDWNGNLLSSGSGTSFTYTHPTPAAYRRLEWQWAPRKDGTIIYVR